MNVKDVIETEILSNGMDGEGVARVDGKVVFIPYTLKGEVVRAVVKQVKSRYVVASAIKIIVPSPRRVVPACPHYFKCGGCDTGHIADDYRREILLNELKNNLKKIADIDFAPHELISAGACRNKLSMPFGLKDGKVVLGLYRQNTHEVEPVDCMYQDARAKAIAAAVCAFANERGLSVYDERSGRGALRHLVLRTAGERTSATLVVNADKLDCEKALAERLPDYCDFFISENTRRSNVVMGEGARLVKGNARLAVNVSGVRAELSPLSFFQVNDGVRDALYKAAISEISSPVLIDLYSGIGITSNLACDRCERVLAVECVPQAVKDADRTAELNGNADKIRNYCGNVEDVLPTLEAGAPADVLIDPPRKGCGAAVMRAVAKLLPRKVIYISCNHATMCRDIKALREISPQYQLTACTAFDMFVGTHHVETLVVLSKKTPDSHINIDVEFGEGEGQFSLSKVKERAEARKPKEKVTYKMIQEYIEQTYGFKVHTAYIAEVKRDLGLPMYDAPNAVEELKKPRAHPTPKMVEAIKETLKHFEII